MFRLLVITLFTVSSLFGRASQTLPKPDLTPNRPQHTQDIHPPPAKNSPRNLPRQEGIYVSLDLLLWQMRMDGLDYAFTGYDDAFGVIPLEGGTSFVKNRWRPGFKVDVGTFLPKDSWRLCARYTYYKNNEASNVTSEVLHPTWNIANSFADYDIVANQVQSAGAQLRFDYNTIDFSLARAAYLSDFLRMEPYLGLKAAWLNQDYTVNYAHQFSQLFAEQLTMTNNQDVYGIGVRSGTSFTWAFDQMLSLYGNGAYSILWSRYNVHRKDISTLLPLGLSEELVNIDTEAGYFTNLSCFEYELGVKFEWWLYKNIYHFEILGLWEMQYWLNQNQLIRLNSTGPLGDLSLTGFTLRMRLDF